MDGRTETLLAHASAYLSAGRVAEAEGAYNAIVDNDPSEHRAHLGLADCVCARGLHDWAVDHLVENARGYAEQHSMRAAFSLMTKALSIAPGRLDLHIDVAEFEALDGRAEMAVLRLENLARTYVANGQQEEAELVLEAASAFQDAPADDFDEPEPAPFINPHTGDSTRTPAPGLVTAATPPAPPPTSRSTAGPRPATPHAPARSAAPPPPPPPKAKATTPIAPPAPAKKKRASRGRSSGPKWRPSTVVNDPPPRRAKKKPAPPTSDIPTTTRMVLSPPPRPRKPVKPVATRPKKRVSIAPAPSPKRGGKKLDKLPPLKPRLRAASVPTPAPLGDEDRTMTWQRAT